MFKSRTRRAGLIYLKELTTLTRQRTRKNLQRKMTPYGLNLKGGKRNKSS
jgi:hypothetical protein